MYKVTKRQQVVTLRFINDFLYNYQFLKMFLKLLFSTSKTNKLRLFYLKRSQNTKPNKLKSREFLFELMPNHTIKVINHSDGLLSIVLF